MYQRCDVFLLPLLFPFEPFKTVESLNHLVGLLDVIPGAVDLSKEVFVLNINGIEYVGLYFVLFCFVGGEFLSQFGDSLFGPVKILRQAIGTGGILRTLAPILEQLILDCHEFVVGL